MLELLKSCLGLGGDLLAWAWGLVAMLSTFSWEVLHTLHVESPRLEGLLVGIALAWLLLRRDRHPLLRVLSSPLKLVVDILDLAWDQVVEVLEDGWDVVKSWVGGTLSWCWDKVTGSAAWVMERLNSLKMKLQEKGD